MIQLLGYGLLAYVVFIVVSAVYRFFLRAPLNLKKYGDWAIVTGATDGIGKALSFELARKGLNIILISRTESKLKNTAAEIEGKYPKVHTHTVAVDFSDFDEAKQTLVRNAIGDKKIAVLVNNVGVGYNRPQFYSEFELEDIHFMTKLNVDSVAVMTKIVLPVMEAQNKGIIVNMSSGSATTGACPMLGHYAATKQWVIEFSKALHYEYASNKKKDIRVQAQNPLYVQTKLAGFNMEKKLRKQFSVPSAATFARASVKAFGQDTVISPYWVHALMSWALLLMPENMRGNYILGMHKSVAKKWATKQAKNK